MSSWVTTFGYVQARFFHHLHDHVAAEHVARVIEHQQQHAVALVGQLDGFEHRLGIGSRENVAHHVDVGHAVAHKAVLGGLMAAAAHGDDGHAVGSGQRAGDDHVAADLHYIGVSPAPCPPAARRSETLDR
jgi:hypothetical protein